MCLSMVCVPRAADQIALFNSRTPVRIEPCFVRPMKAGYPEYKLT